MLPDVARAAANWRQTLDTGRHGQTTIEHSRRAAPCRYVDRHPESDYGSEGWGPVSTADPWPATASHGPTSFPHTSFPQLLVVQMWCTQRTGRQPRRKGP